MEGETREKEFEGLKVQFDSLVDQWRQLRNELDEMDGSLPLSEQRSRRNEILAHEIVLIREIGQVIDSTLELLDKRRID